MKLKKLEVIRLWNAIEACKEHKNTKFIYATLRTQKKLEVEVEVLTALSTPSKKYNEFQQARLELCKKHCEKKGIAPIIENGEFQFSDASRKMFDVEIIALRERYKDWIDERDEQMREYDQALKEEIDIDIHQVPLMYIPEKLDASILSGLMPMIMEE